ncbi:hypothetical protein DITRI_Ditri16bG0105400 [Diplodiscus trichospermus]
MPTSTFTAVIIDKPNMDRVPKPNVAGAMDFHVLVQGNNNTKSITRNMVVHSPRQGEGFVIAVPMHEKSHFHDPEFPYTSNPNINIDVDGKLNPLFKEIDDDISDDDTEVEESARVAKL